MKFEQSKQTTQAFQKSNTIAAGASQVQETMKIKQEPIMNGGNKSTNSRRQPREQFKRRASDRRDGRNATESKSCTRCGRPFEEGHLKKRSGHGQNMQKLFQIEPLCKNLQVTTSK